jgi:transcriptional regulator with XRE-family HTH domain
MPDHSNLQYAKPASNPAIGHLRTHFGASGLTLTEYAKRAGLERSVLARILRADREPSLATGLKLAAFAEFNPALFLVPDDESDFVSVGSLVDLGRLGFG